MLEITRGNVPLRIDNRKRPFPVWVTVVVIIGWTIIAYITADSMTLISQWLAGDY